MAISYSMCWEDPLILIEGLKISSKDSVLSIVSGGENLFAILLNEPKNVVGIDLKKEQIFLTKLKVSGIKNLDFEEFGEFIGHVKSNRRLPLFERLKEDLDKECLNYWQNNLDLIKRGIIHCGKFERYLNKFLKYCLPLIISKNKIHQFLLLNTLKEQKEFYETYWNNWRFRFLFKLFFSRKGLESGRDKEYFEHLNKENISNHYLVKVRHGLTEVPIKTNYFMHYILTGKIPLPFKDHPYLDRKNYNRLKKILKEKKVMLINEDILNYLKKSKENSFSRYNLSDVFEGKTKEEYEEILTQIKKVSIKDSRICYWNNLVIRDNHKISNIIKYKKLSKELYNKDRVHFYSNFIVEKVN